MWRVGNNGIPKSLYTYNDIPYMVIRKMNEEKYKEILRAIMDEKADKTALDKIMYACEQQINIIEATEDKSSTTKAM